MPPVVRTISVRAGRPIGGFLAPGHVCVVAGYRDFEPIAEHYSIPFGVAGFSGRELLVALCGIVREPGTEGSFRTTIRWS
jgi:hydrogenase expression/formation protein HypD